MTDNEIKEFYREMNIDANDEDVSYFKSLKQEMPIHIKLTYVQLYLDENKRYETSFVA